MKADGAAASGEISSWRAGRVGVGVWPFDPSRRHPVHTGGGGEATRSSLTVRPFVGHHRDPLRSAVPLRRSIYSA